MTTITALPTPPSRSDPANFAARADAFMGALPQFGVEVNAVAGEASQASAMAIAAATTAVNAPGTSATSTSSRTIISTGSISFTIQTGKLFMVGQTLVAASTASPTNQMVGVVTAHNNTTGALTLSVASANGSGTFADWTISISAIAGVPIGRMIGTSGLATGGGDLSANRTIDVPAALKADVLAGISTTKAVTPKALMDAAASFALAYASTITPDLANGFSQHVTLTGSATLANPNGLVAGAAGRFRIAQDGTGGRTLAFGGKWKFPGGAPSLSTAANAVDLIAYFVHDTNTIEATIVRDVR